MAENGNNIFRSIDYLLKDNESLFREEGENNEEYNTKFPILQKKNSRNFSTPINDFDK